MDILSHRHPNLGRREPILLLLSPVKLCWLRILSPVFGDPNSHQKVERSQGGSPGCRLRESRCSREEENTAGEKQTHIFASLLAWSTAMAAGLALIPLALGGGKSGSEIQTPMAIVILCGLTTSTLLNMIVVPTMYLRYGKAQ